MNTINHFFYMGGYGFYVWTSYGCVLALLAVQWLIPWRRFQTYLHKQKKS